MISNNLLLRDYIAKHGDDRLILGHRIAEWCGHAPILEEDIALTNISLDLIGQASMLYKYAAEIDGTGINEDYFPYRRPERDFRNLLLVEQPNEDFAFTIARQFYFDVYDYYFLDELQNSKDANLSAIAVKSIKETKYHLRHSTQWMLRLGDGTEESHSRLTNSCEYLWMYTGEMFVNSPQDLELISHGIAVDVANIKEKWLDSVMNIKREAGINLPDPAAYMQKGGREGIHTENLGHILAEMQYLVRTYPDAKW